MSQKPLVSVCMITYNHEKYIAQAIEGVLMQETDFMFELVVADDCSTDSTSAICNAFRDQNPDTVRIIQRKLNLGMVPNLVDALENCRGEYIALCEGDDYWSDPDKLQKQISFMKTHPEYAGCATNALRLIEQDKEFHEDQLNQNFKEDIDVGPEDILAGRIMLYTATLLFRNHLFNFDLLRNYSFGDEFIRLLVAWTGPIRFLNQKTSVYRIQRSGAMHTLIPSNPHRFFKDQYDFLVFYDKHTRQLFNATVTRKANDLERLVKLTDPNSRLLRRFLEALAHLRSRETGITLVEIDNVLSLGFPRLRALIKKVTMQVSIRSLSERPATIKR